MTLDVMSNSPFLSKAKTRQLEENLVGDQIILPHCLVFACERNGEFESSR